MQVEGASDKRKRWQINYKREMIPYKLHFFLHYGVSAAVKSMLITNVLLQNQMSRTPGAIIFIGARFLTVFTKPAISAIADYFNKLKLITIVLIVLETFFVSSLVIFSITKINDDDKNSNDRFSTSFTIQCDPLNPGMNLKVNETSCQVREAICHSRSLLNETKPIIEEELDKSRTCDESAFHCCRNESRYSPQSMRQDFLRCSRRSSEFYRFDGINYCFPFTLTEYDDHTAKLQGRFSGEIAARDYHTIIQRTNSLCLPAKSSHKTSTLANTNEILLFLTSDEDFFSCYRSQFGCGALEDLLHKRYPDTSGPDEAKKTQKEYEIWLFGMLWFSATVCLSGIITLSDTICHEASSKYQQEYGKQRLWGSIGEIIMSLLEISLYLLFSEIKITVYLAISLLIVLCFVRFLEIANLMRLDLRKPKPLSGGFREVFKLFKTKEFVLFYIGVIAVGFLTGVNLKYLSSFVRYASNEYLVVELIYLTQSLAGDLPFMYFSSCIINKIGYNNVLVMALLGYAVKSLWCGVLFNSWGFLPIEITHGFCFGVFYVAMTTFAKSVAPTGMEATTQSILSCSYAGVGIGLGYIAVGLNSTLMEMRFRVLYCTLLGVAAAAIQYYGYRRIKIHAKSEGT